MKDHLIFDASDLPALKASDSVGAYVRSSKSGALVTNHSLFNIPAAAFTFVDGDVATGTEIITAITHNYRTGDIAQLTTTGVLPAGLALVTDYFIIRVDANNIKLAASAFDAENNIPVDITAAAGGGTHTVTGFTRDVRALDVFANLADGEGNKITSTGGALDVNLKSPVVVNVDLDGVYSGSNLLADSVGNIFNTRAVTPGITGQVERATVAQLGNIALADVTKVHALDVNSFLMAEDSVSADRKKLIIDGTTSGLWVEIKNTSPIAISGTVTANAGTGTFTVSDAAQAAIAIATSKENLAAANVAQNVATSVLANRKYLFIYNKDNREIYIGASGVSEATGYPVFPGSAVELRAGAAIDIEFVSSKLTHEIRTMQLS